MAILKEIKYRPTILNILSSGLVIYGCYLWINLLFRSSASPDNSWAMATVFGLVLYRMVGLTIDIIIQMLTFSSSSMKMFLTRNGIGLVLLAGIHYYEAWNDRKLEIILPENFESISCIVYNFPEAKKLPVNLLTLDSEVSLPASGMIFTKSDIPVDDVLRTDFINQNGFRVDLSIKGDSDDRYSDIIKMEFRKSTLSVRIYNLGDLKNGEMRISQFENQLRNQLKDPAFEP